MFKIWQTAVAASLLAAAVVLGAGEAKAGCGDGIVNSNEECDPGGGLFCNGDPSLGSCRTGAQCASGVNCYFVRSCCKFNCQYVGQGATCFDGNECTGPDRCNNVGECIGSELHNTPCNDGDICTGGDLCKHGACQGNPDAAPVCDDGDVCTDDVCDPAGGCTHAFNTAPCNDGQFCTANDSCSEGTCAGTPSTPASCNDGNTCTDDACDPAAKSGAGACVHSNNISPCNDGNQCTKNDSCSGGACSGTPFVPAGCDDGNVCTNDTCDVATGACAHVNNSAPCDDSKFCTIGDTCNGGACASGSAYDCSDGNACTADTCDEVNDRCVNVGDASQSGNPCDDGNACTKADTCDAAGNCSGGTPVVCPANPCTGGLCDPSSGCSTRIILENPTCQSCDDGLDNDGDNDTDIEDTECSTLAPLARFAILSVREARRHTLYSGGDVTVAAAEIDGFCDRAAGRCACPTTPVTCELEGKACAASSDCGIGTCNASHGRCECPSTSPIACRSHGRVCSVDSECVVSAAGFCNPIDNRCDCPSTAPDCVALDRQCQSNGECGVAPFPLGPSLGGVCGHSMEVRTGTEFGFVTTVGDVIFGKGKTVNRELDLKLEFANDGGEVTIKDFNTPLVGPAVCSNDMTQSCTTDATCGGGTCNRRRRLNDGTCSSDASIRCLSDAGCPGGTCVHPFVTSNGTSDNFRRCTPLLDDDGLLLSRIGAAVAEYVPSATERVSLEESCIVCPGVDTPTTDPRCQACPVADEIRTKAKVNKAIVTLGGGLQILDLERIILGSKSVLILRGQEDTVLVIRLQRQLRLGAEAQVYATDNGTGNGSLRSERILWNLQDSSGGAPRLTRDSLFTGTILAPDRAGIKIGAGVMLDGAIYSQKIHLTGRCTIKHFPFTGLLPVTP